MPSSFQMAPASCFWSSPPTPPTPNKFSSRSGKPFWSIHSLPWQKSDFKAIARAILSHLMIHFYISFHFHPTSLPRTRDTLWVFLITAAAGLNFSTEQGGSPALMWRYIARKMGAPENGKDSGVKCRRWGIQKGLSSETEPVYTYVRFLTNKGEYDEMSWKWSSRNSLLVLRV